MWLCREAVSPENLTAAWYPGPTFRDTWSIISSYIITLVICVWTSVHLNIDDLSSNKTSKRWDPCGWLRGKQWRQLGWMFCALLAPEITPEKPHEVGDIEIQVVKPESGNERQHNRSTDNVSRFGVEERTSPTEVIEVTHSSMDKNPQKYQPSTSHARQDSPVKPLKWTTTHGFFPNMGGIVSDTQSLPEEEQFLPRDAKRLCLG
ncbi:hypothetical protein QBC36DRAFT_314120 [Triangularia setosa]|uniref:Uncharacterized protein n=1 Tax=Triangularia setosa TaxID=2587417 RepID=A0AAN6W0G4_9PEZI|nr:hypothetical protein QBC36DRAFT_314120 [Podospora setosa]